MRFVIHVIIAVVPVFSFAQTDFVRDLQKSTPGEGTIKITQSARLTLLLNGDTVTVPHEGENIVQHAKEHKTRPDSDTKKRDNVLPEKKANRSDDHTEEKENDAASPAARPAVRKVHRYTVSGYRVQIFAGSNSRSSRQEAEKAASRFKSFFPEVPAYTHFFSPRWVCRVGNFRTEAQARAFMSQVRSLNSFSGVTVVRSAIQVISHIDE